MVQNQFRQICQLNDPKQLPRFRSIWRMLWLLVVAQLLFLAVFEFVFLKRDLSWTTTEFINSSIETAKTPATLAIVSLSETLADDVARGLIETGQFTRVELRDDFNEVLAYAQREQSGSTLVDSLALLLGLETRPEIEIKLPIRDGAFGILSASADLTEHLGRQIFFSLIRIATLVLGTFLFVWALSGMLVGRFERGLMALLNWTEKAAGREATTMPASNELVFWEFAQLARRSDKTMEELRISRDAAHAAGRERKEIFDTLNIALTSLEIFATIHDPDGKLIFSNPFEAKDSAMIDVFRGHIVTNSQILSKLSVAGYDLAQPERDDESNRILQIQATNPQEAWSVQVIRTKSDHTIVLASNVSYLREIDQRTQHSEKLEALGRVVSSVFHEFNNMLAIICGCIEVVLETPDLPPSVIENLESAIRAGERAASTTSQLSQLSGSDELSGSSLDLAEWANSAKNFIAALTGPGVETNFEVEGQPFIHVQHALFDAMMINLCKNAADAMKRNGTLHVSAHPATREDVGSYHGMDLTRDYIEIQVTDTGPGVPADQADKIFEPFYTTKRQDGGSGLGLSMVHGFVRNSGGAIQLCRSYKSGARFRMLFPAAEAQPTANPPQLPAPHKNTLMGMRVLVLEDEQALAQIYSICFARHGADTVIVHSLAEARQHLENDDRRFQLSIIDNSLPDGLGQMILPKLKSHSPEAICVSLSGEECQELRDSDDIDLFFQKPISVIGLVEEIGDYYRSGSASQ